MWIQKIPISTIPSLTTRKAPAIVIPFIVLNKYNALELLECAKKG
jgi:hypothetical protein